MNCCNTRRARNFGQGRRIYSSGQVAVETISAEPIAERTERVWSRTATTVTVHPGPVATHANAASANATGALSFLLRSGALVALTLSAWRLGNDLGWTQDFIIAGGIWSHWQVWLALAIGLNAAATHVARPRRAPRNADR
jgi:hypothetical protein